MVCIYCGEKTEIINSRPQHRSNNVWRRRQCNSCKSIFTTAESVDYATAWTVRSLSGRYEPFSRDKLFISIFESCKHRKRPLNDATDLTQTVIKKLLSEVKDGSMRAPDISRVTQVVLNRFDQAASVYYQSFHRKNV
jgi:transcriptional repressor NrdR